MKTMHSTRLEIIRAGDVRKALPLCVGALVVMGALGGGAAFSQGSAPSPAVAAMPGVGGTSPGAILPAGSSVSSSQPLILSYGTPGTHVIVLENTLIRVMTDQALSTKRSKDGRHVSFTVSEDVIVNHVLAIPRGATVHGEVVEDKKAGVVRGSPELTLRLDTLELGGVSYPLLAYEFQVRGASKTKPAQEVEEGLYYAYYGALAGSVVAGRTNALPTRKIEVEDMAAGAAVGAGAVAAASVIGPRPVVSIPAESQMDFYLASPISVQPVSRKEAEELSQRLHPGGPVLYVRGDTP